MPDPENSDAPRAPDSALFDRIGNESRSHEIMLQQAARLARLGYFVFNMDAQKVEVCSEGHAAIFGRTPEEFIRDVSGLRGEMRMMHPDDVADVRAKYEVLRTGERIELEYRFFHKNGSIRYIREFVAPERDETGRVVRGLGSSIDVTEVRLSEQRRAHASRLAALGELTAGVAHDFNNLLAVIMGNAELMAALAEDPELDSLANEVVDAARRGSGLTRRLLAFSQRAEIAPERTDLNDEVGAALSLFERTSLKHAVLQDGRGAGEMPIRVDRDQLQSVLLNLMLNARDAVPVGGIISARTYLVAPERVRTFSRGQDLDRRPFAVVEIADNGRGIPAALMDRVTEPFFTTKSRAEGSGLGLSMAAGFARQSGGALLVDSEEGRGTSVKVMFPIDETAAETHAAPSSRPAHPSP